MFVPLFFVLACSTPDPTITSVAPVEVMGPSTLQVLGSEFSDEAVVQFVREGQSVPAASVTVKGVVALEAEVPPLEPGKWDVVVEVGDKRAVLPGALEVKAPDAEKPCSGQFTQNSEVSVARKVVVLDRFYKDGERDTVRIPLGQVEALKVETLEVDGEKCHAIWVVTDAGPRLFQDDKTVDLTDRAYQIGGIIDKPVRK